MEKHEKKQKKASRPRAPTWSLGIIISDPTSDGHNVGKIVRLPKKVVDRASVVESAPGQYPGPEVEEIMKLFKKKKR